MSWQGLNFDFTGVAFDGGSFSGARFSGGRVTFHLAEFSDGQVTFSDVEFSGSTVNFIGARFSGGTVDFYLRPTDRAVQQRSATSQTDLRPTLTDQIRPSDLPSRPYRPPRTGLRRDDAASRPAVSWPYRARAWRRHAWGSTAANQHDRTGSLLRPWVGQYQIKIFDPVAECDV